MAFDIAAAEVPAGLTEPGYLLRPLLGTDEVLDHGAVMESRVDLRRWEQSTWPVDDFTVADNRADLDRHERMHVEGSAFTYTVMNTDQTECLGCVYLFAPDANFLARSAVTAVGDDRWDDVDAVVYHWVRTSTRADGFDVTMFDRLRRWMRDDWPIDRWVFMTSEPFTEQAELFAASDLSLRFEVVEPDKPGRFLAYAE